MEIVKKIIDLVKSENYLVSDIEELIKSEIKLDRIKLLKALSIAQAYSFDDVFDDVNIELT